MGRAERAGLHTGISMRLYAYDCPEPIAPDVIADGKLHCCGANDMEEAAALLPLFYEGIGEEPPPREACLEKAKAYINGGAFFFWKNTAGKTMACCSWKGNQGLASLGSVFTLPDFRRKHYAQNLVYAVTKQVLEMGLIPMLYTDADYLASNACYEKIGYILRGRLCTLAAVR